MAAYGHHDLNRTTSSGFFVVSEVIMIDDPVGKQAKSDDIIKGLIDERNKLDALLRQTEYRLGERIRVLEAERNDYKAALMNIVMVYVTRIPAMTLEDVIESGKRLLEDKAGNP